MQPKRFFSLFRITIVLFAALMIVIGTVTPALANEGLQPKPPEPQIFKIDVPGNITSLTDLLNRILDFLIRIGALVAVIMIVYAGIRFIFSGGKQENISTARNILLWTIIGYSIIILARGIMFVIQDFFGVPKTTAAPTVYLLAAISSLGDIYALLEKIANWMFTFALIFAVMVIVYAGFLFIAGGGETEKVSAARGTIMGAVIGVAVASLAKVLVTIVQKFFG